MSPKPVGHATLKWQREQKKTERRAAKLRKLKAKKTPPALVRAVSAAVFAAMVVHLFWHATR